MGGLTSSRNNPSFASDAGSGEPSGIYTRRTHKDGTIVKLKRNASIDNFIQDLIAIAVADAVAPLRADLDKIRLEIHTPSTKAGKLFSSREAWTAIKVSERHFRKLVGAGEIQPINPDALKGEHYKFTKTELDRFISLPSGEVKLRLAIWEAKQKREQLNRNRSQTHTK